eukprot:FR741454.1.p1 GENE.FR741454.1~~FR741454.1.p1  ORF type:complete len:231 (+),score=20.31 FR741454.1:69-761(+)
MALMVEEAGAEVENSTTDKTVGEFDVTAGSRLDLPVEIVDKGSAPTIEFDISGTGENVTFGVTFESPKDSTNAVGAKVPPASLYGPVQMNQGLITVAFESLGVASFYWESKAMFRSRKVSYTVTSYPSVAEAHAALSAQKLSIRSMKANAQVITSLKSELSLAEAELVKAQGSVAQKQDAQRIRERTLAMLKTNVTTSENEQKVLDQKIASLEEELFKKETEELNKKETE